MNKSVAKGFTLIELLIVIGILAVLATVTLLVLNPAQMFAQARDSQRISDLNTVKSAIALYLSTAATPTLGTISSVDYCPTYYWGSYGTFATPATIWGAGNLHATYKSPTGATTTPGVTSWIPVPLDTMSGGSPIGSLPVDPSNTATYSYYYACSSTQMTFKLVGNLESSRYATGGSDDKETNDGGVTTSYYETGTNLSTGL